MLAAPVRAAGPVYVLTIDGGINPAVGDYLYKGITQAEREGAQAVVIELDTPGGLLSSTKDIVSLILNAKVPVIVFVSPKGAWAGSAGMFITLAGHVAAMAPGTSIGAAHPVSFLPSQPPEMPGSEKKGEDGDEKQAPSPPQDVMGQKVENFTAAFAESIAEHRERNVDWAIQAVRESVAVTQAEALENNVIDLVAEDLDDLMEQINGRVVKMGKEEVILETDGATRVRIEMGVVNRVFDVISDPQVALLLILAGLLGLYVEFTQPGSDPDSRRRCPAHRGDLRHELRDSVRGWARLLCGRRIHHVRRTGSVRSRGAHSGHRGRRDRDRDLRRGRRLRSHPEPVSAPGHGGRGRSDILARRPLDSAGGRADSEGGKGSDHRCLGPEGPGDARH
jgi:hypothetical protein